MAGLPSGDRPDLQTGPIEGQQDSIAPIAGREVEPRIARARIDAAEGRDALASARDVTALARDRAADVRDLSIAQRDAAYDQVTEASKMDGVQVLVGAADLRRRAAEHRTQAADQRALAAQDRHAAAQDRTRAARDRLRALVDREALAQQLPLPRDRGPITHADADAEPNGDQPFAARAEQAFSSAPDERGEDRLAVNPGPVPPPVTAQGDREAAVGP